MDDLVIIDSFNFLNKSQQKSFQNLISHDDLHRRGIKLIKINKEKQYNSDSDNTNYINHGKPFTHVGVHLTLSVFEKTVPNLPLIT